MNVLLRIARTKPGKTSVFYGTSLGFKEQQIPTFDTIVNSNQILSYLRIAMLV
jgi:hypothetical protein